MSVIVLRCWDQKLGLIYHVMKEFFNPLELKEMLQRNQSLKVAVSFSLKMNRRTKRHIVDYQIKQKFQ